MTTLHVFVTINCSFCFSVCYQMSLAIAANCTPCSECIHYFCCRWVSHTLVHAETSTTCDKTMHTCDVLGTQDGCCTCATMTSVLCVFRCKAGADDFAIGMNDVLGMHDVITQNPVAYFPLFVSVPEERLTRDAFKKLCVTHRSVDGSNKAVEEEDTLYSWEVFLLNVEG